MVRVVNKWLVPLVFCVLFQIVSVLFICTRTSTFSGKSSTSSSLQLDTGPKWLQTDESLFTNLLNDIQHPDSCLDRNFLVFVLPKNSNGHFRRGFGAIATSLWRFVVLAMLHNRTVVIDSYDWDLADCPSNLKMEEGGLACYFKPFSSCTMLDVLKVEPNISNHVRMTLEWDHLAYLTNFSVVVAPQAFSPNPLQKWIPFRNMTLNLRACELATGILTTFLAPNLAMQDSLRADLYASLPADFDPNRTLGLPIRASDKCVGHKLKDSSHGEMQCSSFEDYMQMAEDLAVVYPEIDSIIVTSEDPDIIEKAKNFVRGSGKKNWRFIFNVNDVMQGTGTPAAFKRRGVWKVMTSTFASLYLHLQARFLITHAQSSFLFLIGILHAKCDSCCRVKNRVQKWQSFAAMCDVRESLTIAI